MPNIDLFSFFVGFAIGIISVMLWGRARPLWDQFRENLKEQREAAKVRRTSGLEDNHRRLTLRRAQGMHLAAPLFALDDILQEPRLMAPPPRVEPGVVGLQEDIISQTLPYLPGWNQLAGIYGAPTLSVTEALQGGSNIVIVGGAGAGKTVSLAHLASVAANLQVRLEAGSSLEAVPYLYHVADLRLPFDSSKDPLQTLINAASEYAPIFDLGRLPTFITRTFTDGQALLLIDGFDELDPQSQTQVVDWFKALSQAYPKARIVTTGLPDQLTGLISLGFNPLAVIGWNTRTTAHFIQQWGETWSRTVELESLTATASNGLDPIILNSWIATDNHGLTPFELTLKLWGAYAGDSLGPRVMDAIATHVRRVAPTNTPVAALELLAMQVALTAQPIFDPRTARSWVKQYDIVDDAPIQSAEGSLQTESGKIVLTESQKIRIKKSNAGDAVPSHGLLGKMVESGLLVSHQGNKMRFLHSVLIGYLAGQAIGDNDADATLVAQPDWNGKALALQYLAARGDATIAAEILLKDSELPLYKNGFAVARWLRDAPKDAPWKKKAFAQLLQILQAEGQPLGLRAQALAAFVASNDSGAATLFRQLLTSRSFELIPLAALGCGAMRDVKAIETLQQVLQAPSINVRRAACLALVAIGTEASLEAVAVALIEGDEELRRAAAEALANDPTAGYATLKEGSEVQDIMLRRAVVHGLARIEQPWAEEILVRMQTEDDQWVVRNLATQYIEQKAKVDPRAPRPLSTPSESAWLIEFAGKHGMGVPRGSPATEVLITAFKLGDTEERLAALPYLKRVSADGIVGAIYAGMYGEDLEVREASFLAVQEIGANGHTLPHPNQFGLG